MVNIGFKSIKPTNEYVDLEEELGITFETNKKYQIQIVNSAYIIISDTKPTEGGFLIFDNKPFGYQHIGQKLWLKTIGNRPAVVNVSEE